MAPLKKITNYKYKFKTQYELQTKSEQTSNVNPSKIFSDAPCSSFFVAKERVVSGKRGGLRFATQVTHSLVWNREHEREGNWIKKN